LKTARCIGFNIDTGEMVLDDLIQKLSKEGTITTDSPSRWSTYKAPNPIAVVNVNSEQDVAETVIPPRLSYSLL
jgi:hypothetical protein